SFNPDPTANARTAFVFKVDSGGFLRALGPGMSVNGAVNTPVGATGPSTGAVTTLSASTGAVTTLTVSTLSASTQLTAPTVASSDNSTKAATTAWAKFRF